MALSSPLLLSRFHSRVLLIRAPESNRHDGSKEWRVSDWWSALNFRGGNCWAEKWSFRPPVCATTQIVIPPSTVFIRGGCNPNAFGMLVRAVCPCGRLSFPSVCQARPSSGGSHRYVSILLIHPTLWYHPPFLVPPENPPTDLDSRLALTNNYLLLSLSAKYVEPKDRSSMLIGGAFVMIWLFFGSNSDTSPSHSHAIVCAPTEADNLC